MCAGSAYMYSQVHYYIRPSLDVHCPQDPCLTLPQLAANFTSYLGNETNISLSFLPGNHGLDRELSLSHANNFSMTRDTGGNGTVFVECVSQSGRFNISETTFATIRGLHFIGCGGNRVSRVEQFIVEDTIFQGVEGRGTALVLNEVTAANIARSLFRSNTHGSTFEQHDIPRPTAQDIVNYVYQNRNSSLAVGGALYTAFSNVSIASSKFTDNTAKVGGAMFAYNSSLHVVGSTYSYNRASFGGVMITSESSVNIDNSTFSENTAEVDGGVIMTYRDSFSISGTTFSDNTAERYNGVICAANGSLSINGSTFTNNSAAGGGVMRTSSSSINITSSTFTNNSAAYFGGVMGTFDSSFNITSSTFTNNSAARGGGGVMDTSSSSINITSSTFTNNSAAYFGGVMGTFDSSFNITSSTFTNNSAARGGGVMDTSNSSINITSSTFTNNSAAHGGGGGVMDTSNSSINITSSTFTNNSAAHGGVMDISSSSINITSSTFTNNSAAGGGVMDTSNSSINITSSTFINNSAAGGGVMDTSSSSINITSSTFTNNSAAHFGGVMGTFDSSINITSSNFTNNSAAYTGGVMITCDSSFNITSSTFTNNSAAHDGGVMDTSNSSFNITSSTFTNNNAAHGGVMRTFNSPFSITSSTFTNNSAARGGVTYYVFASSINIVDSSFYANNGGAILATESKIVMYGDTTIANNTSTNSSGGGIFLQQSELEIKGNCTISGNYAMRGGGIHATSSTVAVYQPWTLQFINNRAENGSGLYLEDNPKLYVLKSQSSRKDEYQLLFYDNYANYGGAIYVADDTNSGACSPNNECFIQTLALYQSIILYPFNSLINIHFSSNTASEQGANLFGGLLDRCIPSSFAEVYQQIQTPHYSGVSYLEEISNITALDNDTISSLPVRVCFCNTKSEPDCSYQPPTVKVKKGEAFTVSLVAVDQVNHSVNANIISSLSSQDGGFSEGQQTQSVGRICSNVTFNVFSPHDSEKINLFADGPCGSSMLSTQQLHIQFTDCICPVGFQPRNSETRCECMCDLELSPYITDCNSTTESLVRMSTNSWITHINDTGYVIHPNCPFDYCQPPTINVHMNLNLPNGADAQCAYNRSGVLCGACQEHLSLSLGSSRCLPCHSHWPAVLILILLAAIIAGILLVTALLALNMTVAVGLINGFIFYANIVAANSAVFFPSSEPSFPTVFVAWLNLDIGIDVCFFDGLDAYIKTWFQLAFPVYIISLVIIVIVVSEYSPRFAGLIGKRDPVATLATLILLSYAKLLSVTITALSFAILYYPDGSRETVWLPDGNVKYFQGKHIALVLMALLIILIGVPYTILLFLWQWLVCAPKWKVFKWTRNTKLNAFISVHHVPYNSKYRYWTGLLLLMRVVLYITASVTVSGDPQTSLLVTTFLLGILFIMKEITGVRVYKKSFVNIIEIGLYVNLLTLAAFSLYHFKTDIRKQTAMAYTSTIITFILLVGVIIYHVYLLVRKDQPTEEVNEYPLAPVQPAKAEVTHSVIELPKPRDQSPPPEVNFDEIEVKELTATPVYQ